MCAWTRGGFGEKISTQGLDERNGCIGDQFPLGDALLQVSQGRQPCWKPNDRFDVQDMARRVQTPGRTGWYYRVLQAGIAKSRDRLELKARLHPDWTLCRLNALLFGGVPDRSLLVPALQLPLVPSWRKLVERRLQHCEFEDWSRRIDRPVQDASP